MNIDLDKIFVWTNPLAWAWFLGLLFAELLKYIGENTGVTDWYFVLFKLDAKKAKAKTLIVDVHENRVKKLFWLKQKAWDYATAKIKKTQTL